MINKSGCIVLILGAVLSFFADVSAQGVYGKRIGFGGILGDPNGITMKYWIGSNNALAVSGGYAYFGDPRVGAEYLWNFKVFKIRFLRLYAGPGLVLGFGNGDGIIYKKSSDKFYYRKEKGVGIALRGVGGVSLFIRELSAEMFFETGPLLGLLPETGIAIDVGLGIRYYP
jgi:hypothetical protein